MRKFSNGDRFRLPNGLIVEAHIRMSVTTGQKYFLPCEKVDACWAEVRLVPVKPDFIKGTFVYWVAKTGILQNRSISVTGRERWRPRHSTSTT